MHRKLHLVAVVTVGHQPYWWCHQLVRSAAHKMSTWC